MSNIIIGKSNITYIIDVLSVYVALGAFEKSLTRPCFKYKIVDKMATIGGVFLQMVNDNSYV